MEQQHLERCGDFCDFTSVFLGISMSFDLQRSRRKIGIPWKIRGGSDLRTAALRLCVCKFACLSSCCTMLTSYLIHRPALMALLVGWDGDQFVGEMMGRWGKTWGSTSCQPRRTTRFALQNRGVAIFIAYCIILSCIVCHFLRSGHQSLATRVYSFWFDIE